MYLLESININNNLMKYFCKTSWLLSYMSGVMTSDVTVGLPATASILYIHGKGIPFHIVSYDSKTAVSLGALKKYTNLTLL